MNLPELPASLLEPPNVLVVRWLRTRGEVFSKASGLFGDEMDGSDESETEVEEEGVVVVAAPPPQQISLALGKAEANLRLLGEGDADGDGLADGPEEATLSVQDYW